jgi:hypothetical protein
MNYINFLCNHQAAKGLSDFAGLVSHALPLARSEIRESANYFGGEYLKAEIGPNTILTVAMSDEDFEDLPLWIHVAAQDGSAESTWERIRTTVVEPLLNAGFSIARIDNFGKSNYVRVDL